MDWHTVKSSFKHADVRIVIDYNMLTSHKHINILKECLWVCDWVPHTDNDENLGLLWCDTLSVSK